MRARQLRRLIPIISGGGERFDWYVDSVGGNNANAGTSPSAALQTLAALVAKTIAVGQKVGHRRGSNFRETLTLPSSGNAANPITYKPYNSGAAPIINGSNVVSGAWTQLNDLTALVADLGGDAAVKAVYDARSGVTASGGYVDAWDDARGAVGYGPQLTAALTVRPAYDAVNKLLTFDGSNDQLVSAASALFNMSTGKTLVIIASPPNALWKVFIELTEAAEARWMRIRTRGSAAIVMDTSLGTGNPLNSSGVNADGTLRLMTHDSYAGGTTVQVADTALSSGGAAGTPNENHLLCVGSEYGNNHTAMTVKAVLVLEGVLNAAKRTALQLWAVGVHGAVLTSGGTTGGYANVWSIAAATEPKQVFFNGTLGTKAASAALCNSANKWYWAANVLYVYSATDPATAFANPGIEISQRNYCINYNGGAPTWPGNYVTIDGLSVVKSNLYGVRIDASDHTISGCKVQNCLAQYNYDVGIFSWAATSQSGQIQILNNECSYNGIQAQIDGTTAAPTGIEILGSDPTHGTLVEGNNIHHNAWGMELDQGSELTTVRYNNIHDNIFMGLNIDNSDHNTIYYNLLISNGTSWQFRLWDAPHGTVTDNEFYNNTLYGGQAGILVEDTQSGTKIKNNIVYNPTGLCLTVDAAAAASLGAGDIDYNCYWKVGADPQMWSYNGVTYTKSQFAAYQAASGQDANSIVADPLFVGAADYHLQAGSPCDGAGVDVGLTQDYSGAAVANPPSIGAYEA
jgi:parallel beta-helix repeat protein